MAEMKFEIDSKLRGKLLENSEEALRLYGEHMKDGISEGINLFQRKVVEKTSVNTGYMRGSIFNEVRGTGLDLKGIVGTPVKYAVPLEDGQSPHWPPSEPIQIWVARKGIALRGLTVQQVAYLIRRKISKSGTKGIKMFKNAFEENKDLVVKILEKYQKKIIDILGMG